MPFSRVILDSSPIAVPSPRKHSLKRSASTASLPTPPHTLHKRKHSRDSEQQSDGDSSSEKDRDTDGDDFESFRNKKRRTSARLRHIAAAEEESRFWTGPATKVSQNQEQSKEKNQSVKKSQTRDDTRLPSASPSVSPVPLKRRPAPQAPVSPPPSRRQTTQRIARPTTPNLVVSSQVVDDSFGPVRDSPNNPFLASPESPFNNANSTKPRSPSPSSDFTEKPTITYVFRGMKAEFDNPLYQLSPSSLARAALPVEDPEFSPTAVCPPRLLFPEAHKVRKLRSRPTRSSQSPRIERSAEIPQQLTLQKELELLQSVGEKSGKREAKLVSR